MSSADERSRIGWMMNSEYIMTSQSMIATGGRIQPCSPTTSMVGMYNLGIEEIMVMVGMYKLGM